MKVESELESWVDPEKPKKKREKWRIYLMIFYKINFVINIVLWM